MQPLGLPNGQSSSIDIFFANMLLHPAFENYSPQSGAAKQRGWTEFKYECSLKIVGSAKATYYYDYQSTR